MLSIQCCPQSDCSKLGPIIIIIIIKYIYIAQDREKLQINKKFSCRRRTALRFVSLDILLSQSRSLKVTVA